MESITSFIAEIAPVLVTAGGLLWSFSKQITRIEAELQALQHQMQDCKTSIEQNRQGRIEIFGVINSALKPKDNEVDVRLARVEETIKNGISPAEVYTRLAKIEAELNKES